MGQEPKDLRKSSLDLLRFPLAIVVVIVHVFSNVGLELSAPYCSYENYRFFMGLNTFISSFLRGISVPIYFFISGYVFFVDANFDLTVYKRKIKNRLRTLLVPYIVWNTLAILLVVVKQLPIFSFFLSSNDIGLSLNLKNILSCYWHYNGLLSAPLSEVHLIEVQQFPINTALWFLRDLMLIVILTPVMYSLVRRFKMVYMGTVVLIYSFAQIYCPEYGMISTALMFFSWGAYMSIWGIDIIEAFKPLFIPSLLLYFANGVLYGITYNLYPDVASWFKLFNTFVGLILLFNIAAFLLRKNLCKVHPFLASSSFFIYIAHCLIIHRLTKVFLVVIRPDSDALLTLVYVLTVAVTVTSLLICYYILKKYTPKVLKIITGRK